MVWRRLDVMEEYTVNKYTPPKIEMKKTRRIPHKGGVFRFFSRNVDAVDSEGLTDLYKAVRDNNIGKVRTLLNKGADVNISSRRGNTPLHQASVKGYLPIVLELLIKNPNVNRVNQNGDTPLHFASETGRLEIIDKLVDAGANVNIQNMSSTTPLHFACLNGYLEVINRLVDAGADVNIQTLWGQTPLFLAINRNRNSVEIVERLLALGANVNMGGDIENGTPLHKACYLDNIDIVNILLGAGADVNIQDNEGRTPLDVTRPFSPIRNILLNAGAIAAPPAAAAHAGIAFEIHNAFDKINKQRFIAFIEQNIPGVIDQFNAVPTNSNFGRLIVESMQNLYNSLPSNRNANRIRKEQALTHLNAFQNILSLVYYDDETRKILFYALKFVEQQPAEFKNQYIKNFTYDCALAYNTGANQTSCVKGIMERIVTTLTATSLLYTGTPMYDELVSIINPMNLNEILAEVGAECGRLPDVTEEQFRACVHEKIQQQFEAQGSPYYAAAVNTALNAYVPTLGIFGGARKIKKTRKAKFSKRRVNA